MNLESKLALSFSIAVVGFGLLLFIPAGSLKFWQGWSYLVIWFVPGLLAFVYFYKHDPPISRGRLRRKEKVREQRPIMKFICVLM